MLPRILAGLADGMAQDVAVSLFCLTAHRMQHIEVLAIILATDPETCVNTEQEKTKQSC
jgi:hypothetical protein